MIKAAESGKVTAASIAEARRQVSQPPEPASTPGNFITPTVIVAAALGHGRH